MMLQRLLLMLFVVLALAVSARAEVYESLELGPIEALVVRHAGSALSAPTFVTVNGQQLRISRWMLPLDLVAASAAIEADMFELLDIGQGRVDATQMLVDGNVVFAALAPDQVGAPMPRYSRTILLQADGPYTELVVTDDIAPGTLTPAASSPWSLDGVPPAWTGIEHLPGGDMAVTMFVYPPPGIDLPHRRAEQLAGLGFTLGDLSQSQNGTMMTAWRGREALTSFFYLDQDGALVEIINHQDSSRPGTGAGN
jgi:hypothetical protein